MSATQIKGFRAVVRRELRSMTSRPLYLLLALVFPLTTFGFFWVIFQQGIPRDLPVAVIDQDNSRFSRQITRMIDATPSMQVGEDVNNILEGQSLLRSGKYYALIVLSKNLEQDAMSGQAPAVINYYNNEFLLAGSIINRDVRRVIGTVSAGIDLRRRQSQGDMPAAALAHLEPIQINSKILFNPYTNYMYFLGGTLNPTMLQIFVLTLSIFVLGIELKDGTAQQWLDAAGGNAWKAVGGKLLPYTAIFILVGCFMNTFHFHFLGAPVRGSELFIQLSTVIMILAYQAIALFFVAVSSNLRLSLSAGAFYSATAFAFVGMTFPIMAMPFAAQAWGALLPLTYYLKIFVDQSMRGAIWTINVTDLGMLLLFVCILTPLAMRRMPRLMTEPKFWGKV